MNTLDHPKREIEEKAMKCATCRFGETKDELVTQFLERDGKSVIIREVPASVCTTCGEVYFGVATTKELLHIAEQAIKEDARILEKTYSAA